MSDPTPTTRANLALAASGFLTSWLGWGTAHIDQLAGGITWTLGTAVLVYSLVNAYRRGAIDAAKEKRQAIIDNAEIEQRMAEARRADREAGLAEVEAHRVQRDEANDIANLRRDREARADRERLSDTASPDSSPPKP